MVVNTDVDCKGRRGSMQKTSEFSSGGGGFGDIDDIVKSEACGINNVWGGGGMVCMRQIVGNAIVVEFYIRQSIRCDAVSGGTLLLGTCVALGIVARWCVIVFKNLCIHGGNLRHTSTIRLMITRSLLRGRRGAREVSVEKGIGFRLIRLR